MTIEAVVAVALLVVAHVVPPWLHFLRSIPRSRILSAAGGVSVAYVFLHLLPEVAAAQEAVEEQATGVLTSLERHAYVVALAGLVIFYGLERAALGSRRSGQVAAVHPHPVFWLSIGAFTLYNGIVGYLAVSRADHATAVQTLLFAGALGLHFVVNDLGLRRHHHRHYDRMGRPILVLAVLLGAVTGAIVEIHAAAIGLAVALLGGGIILNVVKEELPEERESRFGAFVIGAVAYSALLLAV